MPKRRRKLFPMPVDELFASPKWVALPAAARGMLWSLLEHFWRTDCAPLAMNENTLFPLARTHRPSWSLYRTQIIELFAEVRPELEAYHRQRSAGLAGIRIAAARGGAANAARIAEAAFASTAPARLAPTELGLAPVKAPPSPGAPPRPRPADQRPARPRLVDRGR